MKAAIVLFVLGLFVVPVAGQAGTYVHLLTAPDFQYRGDEAIRIPFTAQYIQNNAPSTEPVKIEVFDANGNPYQLASGQAYLNSGVRPYPARNTLDFGYLPAGLHVFRIEASAGGQVTVESLDFSVILPPIGYEAHLKVHGRTATFFFTPRGDGPFEITVYQEGPGGRNIIEERRTNESLELDIPYVPGDAVKVEVVDRNGWINHENRRYDIATGSSVYEPWIHDPGYKGIQQVKDSSLSRLIIGVLVVAGAGIAVLLVARRRAS